ncbi:MAG: hypothetical protein J0H63_11130 [Rhizobiales bacterium]|nr:hypothetical protein [Hyphomicrobiales bacterium]
MRLVIGLAVFAGVIGFAAANAHLVWTSVSSEPDCVPHLKDPGAAGEFRAARSSC